MTIAPNLSALITASTGARGLRPRPDVTQPGWSFWELRNLNRHRVVGFFDPRRPLPDAAALDSELRGTVTRRFKAAWWRGMAYGVVVEATSIPLRSEDLKSFVDVRENSKGTSQWVLLVACDARTALGIHTWMETFLSPVYRELTQALKAAGFQVASARREKDGLMKLLTSVADMEVALNTFGARKTAFPEFRDHP